MKKGLIALISIICCMTTSCSDDDSFISEDSKVQLQLFVENTPYSRALFDKNYFSSAELGVKLVYAGTTEDYSASTSFVKFTHNSGNKPSYSEYGFGLWTGSTCYLGSAPATVYAYYPYDSSKSDFKSIPVESGQTDYVYGKSIRDVSVKQNYGTLKMQHALAAIRVSAKRGTAKKKDIKSISIQSPALKNKANLNVFTGALADLTGDNPVKYTYSSSLSLSTSFKNTDFTVVPTGVSAPLTIRIVDANDIESEIVTENITLQPGYIYTVEVTADYGGVMGYDKIERSEWQYDNAGDVSFDADNFTVTCTGNIKNIAIDQKIENGVVTISAIPTIPQTSVNQISISGTATKGQDISSDITGGRIITLSDLTSDVILTFDGITADDGCGTIDLNLAENGVYAVGKNGYGIPVEEADETAIAVALIVNDAIIPQRIMIEKNETLNPAWEGDGLYCFYHLTGSNLTNITQISSLNGGTNNTQGTFGVSLSEDYTTWTVGALSYYNGEAESRDYCSYYDITNQTNMGYLLNKFNSSTDGQNQGYTDWYIPSCGQFALILLHKDPINDALSKINGQPFHTGTDVDDYYWTITQSSSSGYYAYMINFAENKIGDWTYRNHQSHIRFIRTVK